jgi:hypothetical protein
MHLISRRCFDSIANWALHAELTSDRKINRESVQAFDEAMEDVINGKDIAKAEKYCSFSQFQLELAAFLKWYDLPYIVMCEAKNWQRFRKLYSHVISECPISYDGKDYNTQHVASITLTYEPYEELLEHPSLVAWTVSFKSGRKPYRIYAGLVTEEDLAEFRAKRQSP